MQLEIQVALSFFISFMYNKLPRRRVNIFADELERTLRCKFASHWYPDRPFKGSAYRCLKTADPVDPVLEIAARESGLALSEIRQTLPDDLSVWIDPGEVSYRVGERGQVKLLYSETSATGSTGGERCSNEERCDREVTSTFDPDAQCFRPIDTLATSMSSLGLMAPSSSSSNSPYSTLPPPPSPQPATSFNKSSTSPAPTFPHRPRAPVTFTTAAFAQTKFGSTKLKSAGKRGSRMSPTEFSNYIKQRAILQQPAMFGPFPPQQMMTSQIMTSQVTSPLPEPAFGGFSNAAPSGLGQMPSGYGGRAPGRVPDAPPPLPHVGIPDLLRPPSAPPLPPGMTSPMGSQMTSAAAQLTPEGQQLLENLAYASNPHLRHLLVAN